MLTRSNYLNENKTIRSWLLTTDHKRIGILYLISILFFFLVGSVAALIFRLELLTPRGDLVTADAYNKFFSLHGIVMVWFFLIPSIPAVLGNFLVPMMIGARDLAFPRLNLLSWYIFMAGGLFTLGGLTGVSLATLGFDIHVHDTYFVVAHFHYIMVGGMVMAFLGGLHFWWPKITGRLYPEWWGRISAGVVFLGFNLTFFP